MRNSVERALATDDSLHLSFVVLGDTAVGKTSLIKQFLFQEFSEEYIPTIREYYQTKMQYKKYYLRIDIEDISGLFTERSILKNKSGYILVYDVDRMDSFENISSYYEKILDHNPIPNIILCANKIEGPTRKISAKTGQQFAFRQGCEYIETSAKLYNSVNPLWFCLINRCLPRKPKMQKFYCQII
jgi:small GTP-binding protein